MVKSVSTPLKIFYPQTVVDVFIYSPEKWRKVEICKLINLSTL